MDIRFKALLLAMTALAVGSFSFGCLSFRVLKMVEGHEVPDPGEEFQAGKTTMGDVLSQFGAPDKLAELGGKDMLLYQRMVNRSNTLSLGIPVLESTPVLFNVDVSAYGGLVRYDTFVFFFTSDGVLQDMVFEKGSSRPYLKAFFSDE